jgi:hypothetical protein
MTEVCRNIQITIILLVLFSFVSLLAGRSEAALLGEIELGYRSFNSEKNGVEVVDANTFYQRYSLMYEKTGRLMNGKLGAYSLALGYEWGSFDTTIRSSTTEINPSISAGHILYNGNLLLAPRELPFRFKAYSRNLDRISLIENTVNELNDYSMLYPNIITDLRDGMHTISGATLMLGVSNGLTNGYNSIFKEVPKIYIDYRDEISNDTKGQQKVDTRLQKLAFVSLNKKDNWFHYRTTRFYDYINSANNTFEEQYQLGTVDHTLNRQWITLTNWIKISTDGQFTKATSYNIYAGDTKTYDLNLFATAVRENWEGSTYGNFSRSMDNQGIQYTQRVPIFLKGKWGLDNEWRVRTSYDEKKSPSGLYTFSDNQDITVQAQMDTFRRSLFTLIPNVSFEHVKTPDATSLISMAGLATQSTQRFSRTIGMGVSYSFTNTESETGSKNSSFTQHDFAGNFSYAPIPELRFSIDQTMALADGSRTDTVTVLPTTQNFNPTSTNEQQRQNPLSGFRRATTKISASWTPVARLRASLTATEDYYQPNNGEADYISSAGGRLIYTLPKLVIDARFDYSWRTAPGIETSTTSAFGTINYTPRRNVNLYFESSYTKLHEQTQDVITTSLVQRINYKLMSRYNLGTPLLDLTEEIAYWKGDSAYSTTTIRDGGLSRSSATEQTRFSLQSKYYPLRNLYLTVSGSYSMLHPGSDTQIDGSGGIGIDYRKLKASVDYSYGRRDGVDKRVEKRLMANMKKFF